MTQAKTSDVQGAAAPPGLRLEERIYHDLLGRIQTGTYAQGERLPTENELAAEFGVSRPVIRAALARLREAGLIVSRQGAGSFVSAISSGPDTGYGPLGSIDDIAGFFEFRRFIECETAARAAAAATTAQIAELREYLSGIDADIEAGQATIELDIRFHAAVAELAGNRFLSESLRMLRPHMRFVGQFVRSLSPQGYVSAKMNMQAEHRKLVDAIASGDPDRARQAMKRHVESSEQRIFRGTGNAG
ncbi:FadR/GntR family transcriptional regulator [Pseudoruegeria sp. HB172150]|uniref:FadR/GntR family transcriptional regulator n=1 Tax=Pseudoruegeria sp. HB172150 TaxID=2721164 RepID=UPI001553B90F